MIEFGLVEISLIILLIANLFGIGFFIWGVCSIEDAIRDDLKRYKTELSLEQIQKAIDFVTTVRKAKP